MKVRTVVILIATHSTVGVLGFGVGIYALPILTAPPAPSESEINVMSLQGKPRRKVSLARKMSDPKHQPMLGFINEEHPSVVCTDGGKRSDTADVVVHNL